MKIISKLVSLHDKMLLRDLKRPQKNLGIPLFIIGVVAIGRGWGDHAKIDKFMLVLGGFAVGLAMEKFAQYQVRRVSRKP